MDEPREERLRRLRGDIDALPPGKYPWAAEAIELGRAHPTHYANSNGASRSSSRGSRQTSRLFFTSGDERVEAECFGAPGIGKVEPVERWATFDCYGTLVDWNGGIRRELARIFGEDEARREARRVPRARARDEKGGTDAPYRDVMARVLDRLGAPPQRSGMRSAGPFRRGTCSPKCRRALEQARARGWRLCILYNADRDFIDASMTAIGVPFDRSIVASEIGSYKPAHGHWQAFEKDVGRLPDAHVAASLFHDVAPTSELGSPASGSTGSAKTETATRRPASRRPRIPRGGAR